MIIVFSGTTLTFRWNYSYQKCNSTSFLFFTAYTQWNWRELATQQLPKPSPRTPLFPKLRRTTMNSGNSRKRSAAQAVATPSPQQQQKHHAAMEEEDLDEDVFLEETLLQYEEDSQILRELEERHALNERLQKWKRPPLSQACLSQSQSICTEIVFEKNSIFFFNFRPHAFSCFFWG